MRGGFNLRKSIVYSVILNVVQLAAIAALTGYGDVIEATARKVNSGPPPAPEESVTP